MEKDLVEVPQPDIPDEIRQVDLPEIGETTPHPKPESPAANSGTASGVGEAKTDRHVGFLS